MPTDSLWVLFRRWHRIVLPGILLCLALGCDVPHKPPLLLGTNAWLGYEPLYLSRELGYWTPEQVHLVEYLSSSETLRAFRNREIDAAALTLDEVLLLLQDGVDIKAILITDVSLGGDAILARQGIGSVKALKGHRVAVESSALGATSSAGRLK